MASKRSLLSEDQLQCPICLDVFTDPVSTSCGHNFCMICLKEFWDSSSHCQCPVCKEEFHKRPELHVNTFISSLVAQFKEQLLSKTKKILCDSCTEEKLEALKSCLHCGVSYCNTHLMPHKTTAKLMKHKLIDPVENLEDYICQKHERPLELFCRDDQTCVCQFCTEGKHKMHKTVPIGKEVESIKTELCLMQAKSEEMILDRLRKIEELKHSVELNKKITVKADVVEIFSTLICCTERSQVELPKVMEEKHKAAERRAEEFIKELEQEITELKKRNTELEKLSHTEDHLHLLQIYPALRIPPHTQNWIDLSINSPLSVVTLFRIKIQEMLNTEVDAIDGIIMASSRSLLSEDQLQCSICLDVFTDPVTTSCGHNVCMICLKEFWDSSSHCQCPVCKEEFPKHPELRVNTFISSLAAQFKEQLPSKTKKILCDSCTEEKLEALKSCLHCGVSYCNTHLMPHKTTAKLMKHKLIDPVENLEDYICQKHERPLELFCRDDQMCVCQFCTEGEHKTHNTVSVEEESKDNKTELWMIHKFIQQMIQERLKKIEEIRHAMELNKDTKEKEKGDLVEICRTLMLYTERSQAELEKRKKAEEKQAEEFIKELEQEITELKRRNTELEKFLHTEDHLHLLKIYPSLCSPPHTQDWTHVTINHLSVETLRRKIIQEVLNNGMEKFVQNELQIIRQHAVDVTLDPDTANPSLTLSNDGTEVICENRIKNLPDNPERFDRCVCVLGKEGFSTGRFYYEVLVKGKTKWDLGVVRQSVNRKGIITACPENGFWCVSDNQAEYVALDTPPIPLSLKQAPQKVGVFVDYEEGLISYYDVDAKSHMYSFTGQTFTEKLYPFFSPCLENSAPLIICPLTQVQD
ncbi:E3 ubiquitin-protein ligase TRIM39-like [Hemibagrus wyckioides]|uniref:E3 ubiquitin-protein ligase TRIM39-like n=1 Tax=Hemibagrus wyckioides TaxID=337641 RepID=UPI00266D4E77|nr:E3 ubiquitin-protein ligase TRIM39-like [Hemibagrus wyckioides]